MTLNMIGTRLLTGTRTSKEHPLQPCYQLPFHYRDLAIRSSPEVPSHGLEVLKCKTPTERERRNAQIRFSKLEWFCFYWGTKCKIHVNFAKSIATNSQKLSATSPSICPTNPAFHYSSLPLHLMQLSAFLSKRWSESDLLSKKNMDFLKSCGFCWWSLNLAKHYIVASWAWQFIPYHSQSFHSLQFCTSQVVQDLFELL